MGTNAGEPEKTPEQVELEIAAFMTPHINRARIALVVLGVIYAFSAWKAHGDLSEVRRLIERYGSMDSPELAEARRTLSIANVIVIYVGAAGIANIVLAAIAGARTMLAFNIAAALFIIHTLLNAYASGGTIFFSWLWWLTAILLGMGYQAARKAHKLRTSGSTGGML